MTEADTETTEAAPPEFPAVASTKAVATKPASVRSVASAVSGTSRAREQADTSPLAAYEAIARSARLPDLVAITQRIVLEAPKARPSSWAFDAKVAEAAIELSLTSSDAETPFGNALNVLSSGGSSAAERALASALCAHAIAESSKKDIDAIAADVLWLAAQTPFDPLPLVDRALGEDAADLWTAIADLVRRVDAGKSAGIGRGEALVGCAAVGQAESARSARSSLARDLADPAFLRLVSLGTVTERVGEARLEGQGAATPRGPVATVALALSGLLLATHVVRLVAQAALAYRRPAEVLLSDTDVRIRTRFEMLGRVLRERETLIPRGGLVRVTREVLYPRVAFYAGLLMLVIGSYVGVRAFVDGVRAASPSLLLVGLLVIGAGVAADFVLGSVLPSVGHKCRIVFVPRKGPTVCVGDVDLDRANEILARLRDF